MKDGLEAFLELGSLRNELVHENFAVFAFEKTAQEVYEMYLRAERFVSFIESKLKDETFGRCITEYPDDLSEEYEG